MPEETKHPTCNYFTIRLVSQIVQRWYACWMYLLGLVKSIWHDKSLGLAAETTRLWISKRRASVVSGLSLWKIPTCTVRRHFITSWRNHVWRPTRVNLRTPALLVILQRHKMQYFIQKSSRLLTTLSSSLLRSSKKLSKIIWTSMLNLFHVTYI